ncbi:MAG: hypothetical protein QOK37_2859 [Thermoanaerobaculia bacterium]|nr:hypothetical protein [Thermoanaerobaculia bacterium]
MVAQTVGVMLGLLGFKDGAIAHSRPAAIIALFIIVLGAWGVFSAVTFEARARRSRDRIDGFLAQLDPNFLPKAKHHTLNYVWIVFHSVIMCLGVVVLALVYCRG